MRLQNKIFIILGSVWLIFLCASYLGAHYFLLKSFNDLEARHIDEDISRVNFALTQQQGILNTFTLDWGHWNDAYDYVNGNNPAFVANNIETLALINYHVGLLMYFNKKGELLLGLALDDKNKMIIPYPKGLEKYVYPGGPLEVHSDPLNVLSGLVNTSSGILFIASVGVSANDIEKPINGTLITGRLLSQDVIKKIAEITNINLALIHLTQVKNSEKLNKIYNKLITSSNNQYITYPSEKYADAYVLLHDISNQPIGIIKLTLPRDIVKSGSIAIKYYLYLFLITGFILSLILLYLINILILKRLAYLNSRIQDISLKEDYTQRIKLYENDELTWLANQFNELMRSIEIANNKLKEKVQLLSKSEKYLENTNLQLSNEIKEREQAQLMASNLHHKLLLVARSAGMADIITGVLHNIGNILNSIVTSVGCTREKVSHSKYNNLGNLANLFNQNKHRLVEFINQDNKGDKIAEYLLLLAKEWKDENEMLAKELILLEKNINNIVNVIVTQQSLGRLVGMVEQFNLIDTIEDAITLNKAIADKYNIQFEREFRFAGSVELDRVKLLHIIVNLIKNSIESLVNCNLISKMIIIKTYKLNDTQLVIEVIDNGEGILPENIVNIFTYGFTTKKNGHGFGLHSSALLAAEMGGKLSAKSFGLDKGASFILELPIQQIQKNE